MQIVKTILTLSLLLLVGCGDGRPLREPISGRVLIDGKPLTVGFIRVIPSNDRVATGAIDEQGRFQLTTFESGDGCVLGTHPVEIIAFEPIDDDHVRWIAPPKYRRKATSGLNITIDGPNDDLTIELTWDGGQPFIGEP